MQLTFSIPNLDAIMERFQQAPEVVTPILQNALILCQQALGAQKSQVIPYQTGRLSLSFFVRQIGELAFAYGPDPNLKYALYVEQGTGIYGPRGARIVPVTAKVLAWPSGAATHFAHSIAGMTPRRYMEAIMAAATPNMISIFEETENQIVEAMQA